MRYKVVVTLLKILLVAFTVPHLALAKQKPFIPGFSTAEKVNIKADKMKKKKKTNLLYNKKMLRLRLTRLL